MAERRNRYAPRPGISEANRRRESYKAMAGTQTGAKTAEGKARAAARSRKHGAYGAEAYALREWLRSVQRLMMAVQRSTSVAHLQRDTKESE